MNMVVFVFSVCYHLFVNIAEESPEHLEGLLKTDGLSPCVWLDRLDMCTSETVLSFTTIVERLNMTPARKRPLLSGSLRNIAKLTLQSPAAVSLAIIGMFRNPFNGESGKYGK